MQTHIAYLSMEQKARPIGVRIVEPPADTRQAVRGHLYAMIEYGSNQPDQIQIVERALSIIQRTYYSVKGTQTFVLTEALREALNLFHEADLPAQQRTREQGSRTPAPVPGILLLSLIGQRMVLVGTGPAVALMTTGSNVDVYPPYEPGVERDLQSPVEIHRLELSNGGAFLLAGQRCLQHFTLRELASIVAYVTEDNVADVAAALRSQAGADALTGLIAVVSPDDADEAPPTTARSPIQSSRRSGLPAALSTPPPVRDMATHAAPHGDDNKMSSPTPASTEADGAWPETAAPGAANTLPARMQATLEKGRALVRALFANRTVARSTTATTASQPGAPTGTVDARPQTHADADTVDQETVAQARRRHEQAPLPRNYPYGAEALASQSAADLRYAPAQRAVTSSGTAPDHDPAYDDQTLNDHDADEPYGDELYRDEQLDEELVHAQPAARPLPKPSDARSALALPGGRPLIGKRATGRRARLFALAALLILLLTVVIVASVSWVTGSRNVAEAERLLDMADASFLSAQSALDAEDKTSARLRLTEAQALINEATLRVGTRLVRAEQLNSRLEQELAGLLQIYPLQALAAPLVQFPPEAQPQRVVVSDQDIYVLDMGRQLIQHFELDPTRNVILNSTGETVLAQGDNIDGVTVGRLVDITWLPPIAGVDDKAYLLVLDGTNNLFRYDRRVEGVSRVELGGREELRTPTKLRVYADRLYLADAGANQIYRYARGNFATPPERWFGPQTQSNLDSLRSMAIDGDIWLLYEQGLLLRYRTGDQMQFSLETSFGQIQDPVDLAVGDQGNSMIYIADSTAERILVFNKEGGYERQLRAPEGDILRNLRSISVDEVAGTMYILTQSFLFNHPLPN